MRPLRTLLHSPPPCLALEWILLHSSRSRRDPEKRFGRTRRPAARALLGEQAQRGSPSVILAQHFFFLSLRETHPPCHSADRQSWNMQRQAEGNITERVEKSGALGRPRAATDRTAMSPHCHGAGPRAGLHFTKVLSTQPLGPVGQEDSTLWAGRHLPPTTLGDSAPPCQGPEARAQKVKSDSQVCRLGGSDTGAINQRQKPEKIAALRRRLY